MPETPRKGLRAAALRGTFWSALQQIGDKGIRLPLYLVLARLLPPESFGLVALAAAYIDFIELFMNQGLNVAIIQREDLEPEHLDSAFWGNIVFALLLTGFGIATAGTFASIAGHPELAPIVLWLSIAFILSGMTVVQDAILRRALAFKVLAVRTFVSRSTAGAIAIFLAFSGFGVWSLVVMQLVNQALGCALLWRASGWRPRMRFSLRHYRELLAFGISMLTVSLIRFGRMRADNFLIGLALGTTALGYYSIARQLTSGVSALMTGSIGPVLWSTLARLQREPERLARAIYQGAEMLGLLTFPAYFGLAVVAPLLVPLVLGPEWLPSVPILMALALSQATYTVGGLNLHAMVAIGETRWRVRMEALIAAVSLIAMALALPGGIAAVAWASTAALYLLVPVQVALGVRLLPIGLGRYLGRYGVPAAASALMLGAVLLARPWLADRLSDSLTLAMLMLIGGLVYIGTVWGADRGLARRAFTNLRVAISRSEIDPQSA